MSSLNNQPSSSNPVSSDPDVTMGGQAVIEGVMMRGPKSYAVAVRRPQGNIEMISHPFVPVVQRKKWLRLPIARGAVSLVEMMLLGYRALDFSANVAEQAAREQEAAENGEEAPKPEKPERAISRWTMASVFGVSMALAMLLFVALPNITTHFLGYVFAQGSISKVEAAETDDPIRFQGQMTPLPDEQTGAASSVVKASLPVEEPVAKPSGNTSGLIEEQRPITYNLISGMVRLFIIVGYIWLIGRLKDVRRLFQYHGTEHKVVMAYEKKQPLDLEHIRPMTTLHPRCGTTFIAVVLLVSIAIFAVLAALIVEVFPAFTDWSIWVRKPILIALHIVFMPLVAGIAYEVTRRAGKNPEFLPYRLLLLPGFAFQRITTQEPDDSMIEVALASFQEALEPKIISH